VGQLSSFDLHDPQLSDATRAVWLLAVDPSGLGGIHLRGPASAARDDMLASLQHAMPRDAPWRRLPAQIDDDRLLGGLDLALSLATGRPMLQRGLLAEVDGGVLIAGMAERMNAGLAAKIAAALDQSSGSFALVALDESHDADEAPPAALLERLGLIVTLSDEGQRAWPPHTAEGQVLPFELAEARLQLALMPWDEACINAFCSASLLLGIRSMRAPLQAWRAACAAAACRGSDEVSEQDAELAARLVIAPRARQLPAAPDTDPPPASGNEDQPAHQNDAPPPDDSPASPRPQDAPLEDRVIEATKAAIPAGLLALLGDLSGRARSPNHSSGKHKTAQKPAQSGRPLPSRRGQPRSGQRVDVLQTLRAAIPWQKLRHATRAESSAPRLIITRDDFHLRRYQRPRETTTIFAVDASGSQALNRLSEAKGAVELLLADCYVRRDRVALIAFRGSAAETLLLPTRSLVRAKRSLQALPGGGGTPLAAAIEAAAGLASLVRSRDGGQALVVFLTDARANVARDGKPGREAAMADALAAARAMRADGIACLLIDTSPRPQAPALALAQAMAARYVALPQADSAAVFAAVSAAR
jgi:magnesium chelatase subunit D